MKNAFFTSLLVFCIFGISTLWATSQKNYTKMSIIEDIENIEDIDISDNSGNSDDDYSDISDDDDNSDGIVINMDSDSNDDNISSEDDVNYTDLVFKSTSWDDATPSERQTFTQLLFDGYIDYEMLPWISGRPLAIRIVTSVEPATFSDIIDVIVHQEEFHED